MGGGGHQGSASVYMYKGNCYIQDYGNGFGVKTNAEAETARSSIEDKIKYQFVPFP